ncbi:MAG: hypothetical protein GY861_01095 [bacterium]|nr:hypothetical protein [bacterium]
MEKKRGRPRKINEDDIRAMAENAKPQGKPSGLIQDFTTRHPVDAIHGGMGETIEVRNSIPVDNYYQTEAEYKFDPKPDFVKFKESVLMDNTLEYYWKANKHGNYEVTYNSSFVILTSEKNKVMIPFTNILFTSWQIKKS